MLIPLGGSVVSYDAHNVRRIQILLYFLHREGGPVQPNFWTSFLEILRNMISSWIRWVECEVSMVMS